MKVSALDHTLGHDPERQHAQFSVDDRLAIARRLDRLGIDYVEAGCPHADPNVREFFARAPEECRLGHARLVASLRLDAVRAAFDQDATVHALLASGAPVVALSGCCWHAGPLGLQEYCRRIAEAVLHFKAQDRFVIFRADDFFDGYCADPPFALRMLEAAKASGSDLLCLSDSCGGTLPHVIREVCLEVRKRFEGTLGIRAYDDSDLAVACTLEAVEQGFTHVEGSLGAAESSANLGSIIAGLEYKLGHMVIGLENLEGLPGVAAFVTNAAKQPPRSEVPRDPATLLHSVDTRLFESLKPVESRAALDRIRLLEFTGCDLASARGTLELLVRETLQPERHPFEAEHFEVACHSALYSPAMSTATVTLRIGEAVRCESEEGSGPVDALERALRQCLFVLSPVIAGMRVVDYHVRTIEPAQGSASQVRVAVDWDHSGECWTTAAVSEDLIGAAWLALMDGFRLTLMRLADRGLTILPAATDASWAV